MGTTPDCLEVVVNDAVKQTYAKLVLSDDAATLLGGILVGDASAYGMLRPMVGEQSARRPAGDHRAQRNRFGRSATRGRRAAGCGADLFLQQRHQGRSHRRDRRWLRGRARLEGRHQGGHVVRVVRAACSSSCSRPRASSSRRRCASTSRSRAPSSSRSSRPPRSARSRDWSQRFGTGTGCDICKPVVASILASTSSRAHPRRRAGLAAGLQRPLPGQHPAQRQLLGGAAGARRRHHARAADPDRRDRA